MEKSSIVVVPDSTMYPSLKVSSGNISSLMTSDTCRDNLASLRTTLTYTELEDSPAYPLTSVEPSTTGSISTHWVLGLDPTLIMKSSLLLMVNSTKALSVSMGIGSVLYTPSVNAEETKRACSDCSPLDQDSASSAVL